MQNDNVHYWILTGSYDVGKYRLAFLYDKVTNAPASRTVGLIPPRLG